MSEEARKREDDYYAGTMKDDYISRKAVLDMLEEECGSCADTEYIFSLPGIEERKEKWIPCSVEKPKKTGYYICTCHDGVCYRTSVLVWSTGWVLTGVRAYWRVIAWMPLPNPWKGEKE